MVIEELLEDPELAKLEKCEVLAPLYHIKGIGLHICFQRLPSQFYLSDWPSHLRCLKGITRAGVHRSDSPAPLSFSGRVHSHRGGPPLCQDLSPTKRERGGSCRPPCLLLSWHFIKGPESTSLYEWFAGCGLLDLRDREVLSLMLAWALMIGRGGATAFLLSHRVICVFFVAQYQHQATVI